MARLLETDLRRLLNTNDFERRLRKLEEGASKSDRKDIWDKIAALSGLVSGILIAFIGFYATNIYDKRSKELEQQQRERTTVASEIGAVEKLFPYLSSPDENTKQAALLTLFATGNVSLSLKLAAQFGGAGGRAALISIIENPAPNPAREPAKAALQALLLSQRKALVRLEVACVGQTSDSFRSDGFFVNDTGYVLAPSGVGFRECVQGAGIKNISVREMPSLSSLGDAELIELSKGLVLLRTKSGKSSGSIKVSSTPLLPGMTVALIGSDRTSQNKLAWYAEPYIETAVVAADIAGGFVLNLREIGTVGSPILSSNGEAVGIVVSAIIGQGNPIGLAVGSDELFSLLKKNGLGG